MKLKGKAKREFLERMARGRRNAAKKVSHRRSSASSQKRGSKKRRRNPELLTISNPTRAKLAKAANAYRQFHGVDPKKMTKLGNGGDVLIALGDLREIVYQPRRGDRKGPAFFHKFKPGNVLAVTADGKRLAIVDRKKRTAVDFDLGIVN